MKDSDIAFGQIHLPNKYRSAWIIDGQHRLYGFSHLEDRYLDQNLIVVAFENLPKVEEANLFVTINHEQKSVPKHLLDDLEGELKWESSVPSERIGAISARLINQLNVDIGEPLYGRITQQGLPLTSKAYLTIPALKAALRRSVLVGKALLNDKSYELGPLCGRTDSETLDRARCGLNQYFSILRNASLGKWELGREGFLCTNVSMQAYIMLLGSLIKFWEANTGADSREMEVAEMLLEIEEYMSPVTEFLEQADDAALKKAFQVPFGSGGPPEYYFRLCKLVKSKYPDFEPDGMQDWETEQSEEKIQAAHRQIAEIVTKMGSFIFLVLRTLYGEKDDAYWKKGIPDKGIKTKAYERSLDAEAEESLPLETYLDVLDFKKIVENRQNWPNFKKAFNIPEPGEKGLAKNLKWMERINELRRISAHPSEKRHYKVEDFESIDYIHQEFMKRLEEAEREPDLVISPVEEGDA